MTNDRHQGLSQFIVDLTSPGITIRPIRDITDVDHFNEVTFEDVALPGTSLIGTEGQGWNQVGAELALERSGAERFLSSFQAVLALAQGLEQSNDPVIRRHLGRIMAHLHTLRRMSLAVASMLQGGTNPMLQASVVKCLGADLEQELPSLAQALLDIEPDGGGPTEADRVLAYLTLASPAFSLRGGTREILRSVVARGLGL